jgi:hypothetical protein
MVVTEPVTSARWMLLQLALFEIASIARADGTLLLRDRTLFHEGPSERAYCSAAGSGSDVECDHVTTKVLSGYSYARGHVFGALAIDPGLGFDTLAGLAGLQISAVSAALPGGEMALAAVEGVLGNTGTRRLRMTLVEAQDLFFCRDAQSGDLVAPVFGMFTRACRPDAIAALDAALLALQWDVATNRVVAEWLRLGPALELLSNGFGYAHLLRSVTLGLPFDVRTLHHRGLLGDSSTSLGAGLRLSALYRTAHWETRVAVRQRTALLGGAGLLHDNALEGELRLLHSFFLNDALIVQVGISLRGSWTQRPAEAFVAWADARQRVSGFAGLYLGWIHEAPDI